MTERLYYTDSYLREFTARVVERSADGLTLYLDRTAFYPASGGQPFDTGAIAGARVVEVVDEDERIAHRMTSPVASETVECAVDWSRRFDHMQQHTGQHLLSAVFDGLFGLRTVGFHLGGEISTIDLEGGALEAAPLREAERRANEIVCENRPVAVRFQNSAEAEDLRKPSERAGELRIVSIEGLDARTGHRRDRPHPAAQDRESAAGHAGGVLVRSARGGAGAGRFRNPLEGRATVLGATGGNGGPGGGATGIRARGGEGAPQAGVGPGGVPGQGALCRHGARPG
jgi:Ser-tRNA(Ala) deacylase AlaX